ncbi:MAG: HEAT repeat domain-containing protein [Candidatus Limnocylindrales bacterium]
MPLFGGPPDIDRLKADNDVPGLIKALRYQKDALVPQNAARALGEIGDPTAVAPLVASLTDRDGMVRQAAARSLGKIGDARAVEPLIAALRDGWVRSEAVESLGQIGHPAAVGPVVAALDDSNPDVRIAAVRSLGRLHDARAVAPLIAALKDTDRDMRTEAINSLGELEALGDARVVAALIAMLRDEPTVRDPQTTPAGSFAPREALGKAGTPAVEPLIAALGDANVLVRRAAAVILGWIRDHRAIAPLVAALDDENPLVRVAADKSLDALGWSPADPSMAVARWLAKGEWQECIKLGTDAVEPLVAALEDPNAWVREAAVNALGAIGSQRAVEPLAGLLSDQSEYLRVREAAAEALGVIGDPAAVETLLAVLAWASTDRDAEGFLRHEDKALHAAVASAIGKIGAPALGAFTVAFSGWDPAQRLQAAGALDEIGWQPDKAEVGACYWAAKRQWGKCVEIGSPAVETLIPFLASGYVNDRDDAAEALGEIGDPRAVEPLIAALADGAGDLGLDCSQGTRKAAAEALGRIGDARAIGPLVAALEDRDRRVGEAAAAALHQMGIPETQRSAAGLPCRASPPSVSTQAEGK